MVDEKTKTEFSSGLVFKSRVSLKSLTSWQVGGVAELYAEPVTVEQLSDAVQFACSQHLPISVLGGGTNVLVSDQGVLGLTIALRSLSGIEESEQSDESALRLTALAGTAKAELLKRLLREKLSAAIFLAGLPGDVGGGVVMNAGVGELIQPREFVEIVEWVEVMRWSNQAPFDIVYDRLEAQQLQWSYRHCSGWAPGIIVRVGLKFSRRPAVDDLVGKVRAANLARVAKQPLDMPSCGSVFVNPPGQKAGQLIEAAGLKGFSIGGAQVSLKHANFIVNCGSATAADIDQVIRHVVKVVAEATGIRLKTEVVYLGAW